MTPALQCHLAKELLRIPMSRNFKAFSESVMRLAYLYINYESVEPYPHAVVSDSDDTRRTTKIRFGSFNKTDENPKGEDISVLQVSSKMTLRSIS